MKRMCFICILILSWMLMIPVLCSSEPDSINLCPINYTSINKNGLNIKTNGLGDYQVYGTTDNPVNYNLFYSKNELPEGFEAGRAYHLDYEDTSGTDKLRICMYYYDKEGNEEREFLNTNHSSNFIIPAEAKGLLIRIRVIAADVNIYNTTIHPIIREIEGVENIPVSDEKLNYDTDNLCPIRTTSQGNNGVDFVPDGTGQYIVNGTSEQGVNFNLFYSKTELPPGFEAGKTYRLEYTDTSLTNYLRVCVYWYDEKGENEYDLFNSTYSVNFTIPSNAKGLLIRLRVVTSNVTINNAVVKPVITSVSHYEEPKPMLTIIDDDGCAKYYTDLLPLCIEKGVSISSAVVPKQIEERESGKTKFWMSWKEITDCYSKGIEILSHTYDHAETSVVDERQIDEIRDTYKQAKDILHDHGIETNILVYSGNSGSLAKCHSAASDVYDYGIIAGGNVNNQYGSMDPYNIMRYRIQYDYDFDVKKMKELIYLLSEKGTGWMVWMIHTSDTQWGKAFVSALSECIDYAKELNIDIVTAAEGAEHYLWK